MLWFEGRLFPLPLLAWFFHRYRGCRAPLGITTYEVCWPGGFGQWRWDLTALPFILSVKLSVHYFSKRKLPYSRHLQLQVLKGQVGMEGWVHSTGFLFRKDRLRWDTEGGREASGDQGLLLQGWKNMGMESEQSWGRSWIRALPGHLLCACHGIQDRQPFQDVGPPGSLLPLHSRLAETAPWLIV